MVDLGGGGEVGPVEVVAGSHRDVLRHPFLPRDIIKSRSHLSSGYEPPGTSDYDPHETSGYDRPDDPPDTRHQDTTPPKPWQLLM